MIKWTLPLIRPSYAEKTIAVKKNVDTWAMEVHAREANRENDMKRLWQIYERDHQRLWEDLILAAFFIVALLVGAGL